MSRERWNSKNPSTIPEVGKQNSNFLNHGIFGHHTVIIGPRFCVAVLDVLQHSIITRRERKLRNFSKCCLQSVKKTGPLNYSLQTVGLPLEDRERSSVTLRTPTNIYLQKSASIQPRTSPAKICKKFVKFCKTCARSAPPLGTP